MAHNARVSSAYKNAKSLLNVSQLINVYDAVELKLHYVPKLWTRSKTYIQNIEVYTSSSLHMYVYNFRSLSSM